MTRRFALLGLALLLAAASAFAPVPAHADDAYDKCTDASDGSNPAWAACGDELVRREDARLNATWKRVFAETEDETKKVYDIEGMTDEFNYKLKQVIKKK